MNGFRLPVQFDLGAFSRFLELIQPFEATFVERSAESSEIIAEGGCGGQDFGVDLRGPDANTPNSRVSGTVEGCTTGRFLFFGGVNTQGSGTGAISFFYAVPASRLMRATYSFTSDERLQGRASLSTLITINGSFLSSAEKDFFATVGLTRLVRVFDGDSVVLSLTESVVSDSSGGNSDSDAFLGETVNIEIDVNEFLTSQFAVSGDNDLVIRFDYLFSASGKGSLNSTTFSGPGGNGAFSVRNRGVTLQINLTSLFSGA